MKQRVTINQLLSKQTVDKLNAAITKGNMEQLRKHMENLFTFKNTFNLHDDHIKELAESIIEIANAEDQAETAKVVEQYVRMLMSRYQKRKSEQIDRYNWAKISKDADKAKVLDEKYRKWVYEEGYEYSRYQMCSMLCIIAHDAQVRWKEGSK